jgi:hypothetical protein
LHQALFHQVADFSTDALTVISRDRNRFQTRKS